MTLPPVPWIPEFNAGGPAVDQLNTMAMALQFVLDRPRFRARRAVTAWTLTEGVNNIPSWDTVDEDNYGGWSAGTPGRYVCQAAGWYQVTAAVSLSGTGAGGLVLIPGIFVNGASPTGVGTVWEGPEMPVPIGGPKTVPAAWSVWLDVGDYVQLNVWYSSESSITATDITPGFETRIELVWDGA
ncbi:hypothetical protein [Actinomadura montaniterrae]|uniref:Uncharacterized protein n=1 Tax=Actinomadura montaniterrae TaxID=1803903 RepID=A0A6L3W2H8_9ACTN|nr:hypothetical protein [Actinomadura montaniterrae]KAB2384763.1 hypothetical protein F9B16_09960 [Actinomadura montaniterrae]